MEERVSKENATTKREKQGKKQGKTSQAEKKDLEKILGRISVGSFPVVA